MALGDAVEPLAILDEFAVARSGVRVWSEAIERLRHFVRVLRKIENCAVVEETAPLRIEAHELEIIFQARARFAKDAAENGRDRDDGRSHVETEAVAAKLGRFAAEPIVAFEKDDFVSARRQHAGCGKPAETAADDADWFHEFAFLRLIASISSRTRSTIAPKRSRPRPCAARM